MEWAILFMGSVGSGKTQAIQSISDIEVVNTDEEASDEVLLMKSHTTVSMDVGAMQLSGNNRLRLYGAPGQDRFDFMWDILLTQVKGVVLLVNHTSAAPLVELGHYLQAIRERSCNDRLPLVIGVTHMDKTTDTMAISRYNDYLLQNDVRFCGVRPPVVEVDARLHGDVFTLLLIIVAQMEMAMRFPVVSARVISSPSC